MYRLLHPYQLFIFSRGPLIPPKLRRPSPPRAPGGSNATRSGDNKNMLNCIIHTIHTYTHSFPEINQSPPLTPKQHEQRPSCYINTQ